MLASSIWLFLPQSESRQVYADSSVMPGWTCSITDFRSAPVSNMTSGHQYVISTTFTNQNHPSNQSATLIVEVRNSSDFTTQLDLRSQALALGETTDMGVSWIPQYPDTYHIRLFYLTDLNSPEILSPTITCDAFSSMNLITGRD
jgi:hypothetical protein